MLGKKKDTKAPQDDFLTEEAKQSAQQGEEYTLDIPDDEIWTYQIEGLQAPHVNQPFKNAKRNKVIVVIVLLIAISASIFLSVWAVHNDTYEYKQLDDGTYELVKFSNPGDLVDLTIDYVVDLDTGKKDKTKPITVINEYAFNCDETIHTITFGKDVKKIDSKSIYSCWHLQNIYVNKDNNAYCDIDGVLYNKDVSEIVLMPIDHDVYIRQGITFTSTDKNGKKQQLPYQYKDKDGEMHSNLYDDDGNEMEDLWGTTNKYDDAFFDQYNKDVRCYVLPATVKKIGQLALAYANIRILYMPQGVTRIESMATFNAQVAEIYTYTDKTTTGTTYKDALNLKNVYCSLPDGLEYIGSDAFSKQSMLEYIYIPSSVKYIGHHAFADCVTKDDNGLSGLSCINVQDDESAFSKVETGQQWRPRYDYKLFHKSVDINYSAKRADIDTKTNRIKK